MAVTQVFVSFRTHLAQRIVPFRVTSFGVSFFSSARTPAVKLKAATAVNSTETRIFIGVPPIGLSNDSGGPVAAAERLRPVPGVPLNVFARPAEAIPPVSLGQ